MTEREEKERSTVVIASRVSPWQRRLIEVAAEDARLSVSKFVRRAADRAAREQLIERRSAAGEREEGAPC